MFVKILLLVLFFGSMIAGLFMVPLVSLFTPKPDGQLVDDAFSCYDKKVLVPQRDALGDHRE